VPLNKSGSISIAFGLGALAVILANPLQTIFDVLCIMLMKMRVDPQSAKENCNLLAFQCLMLIIVVYLSA
jgi:hypothetical protein